MTFHLFALWFKYIFNLRSLSLKPSNWPAAKRLMTFLHYLPVIKCTNPYNLVILFYTVSHHIVSTHPLSTFSRTKGLTDRVSSRLRGLAVYWRPRPSGTQQYIQIGIYRGIRISIIKLRRVGKCQPPLYCINDYQL